MSELRTPFSRCPSDEVRGKRRETRRPWRLSGGQMKQSSSNAPPSGSPSPEHGVGVGSDAGLVSWAFGSGRSYRPGRFSHSDDRGGSESGHVPQATGRGPFRPREKKRPARGGANKEEMRCVGLPWWTHAAQAQTR